MAYVLARSPCPPGGTWLQAARDAPSMTPSKASIPQHSNIRALSSWSMPRDGVLISLPATAPLEAAEKMKTIAGLFLCAWLAGYNVVHAAESDQPLDVIVVTASRLKPHGLRQMLIETEDRFYARYNELNKRNEFDINCIVAAPTGTNLKRRSCLPIFEERALQRVGQETFVIRQDMQEQIRTGYIQRGPGTPPVSARGEIEAVRPEFQKNMQELVQGDAELQEILKQRAALENALRNIKVDTPGSDGAGESD